MNPAEFTYDANGNLLYDGQFFYHYDAANRLTQIDQAGTGAPGAIVGTVTDDTAAPAEGVQVTAYLGQHEAGTATTAADGTYEIAGLASGDYRIRFTDPQGRYLPEWHDDAPTVAQATEITVAPDDQAVVDAALAALIGSVGFSGTVTDADTGAPIEDATVLVVRAPDPGANPALPVAGEPGTTTSGLPGLRLTTATNNTTGAPQGPPVLDGDPVVFTYEVTNTGLTPLTAVAVTESGGLTIACPLDDGDSVIDRLEPGQSVTCTADTTATTAPYAGTVTVTTTEGPTVSGAGAYVGVSQACTVVGTEGDDVLSGTSGDDIICGLGGNDTLKAKYGNDILIGGAGDDHLIANQDDDILIGGAGNDRLDGDYGNDLLDGGPGHDTLYGNQHDDVLIDDLGDDTLEGGYGSDVLISGAGNDTLEGNQHIDILWAGDGDDDLRGGYGQDQLYAGPGNDTADGNQEIDIIVGGDGADILDGGYGADLMYGGPGDDSLDGRQQADILDGGPGIDTFDGGLGSNHIFEGDPYQTTITTAADGTWNLDAPPGRYLVLVRADGYTPAGYDAAGVVEDLAEVMIDTDLPAVADVALIVDTTPPPADPPPPAPPSGTGGGEPELVATYTYDGGGTRQSKTTADGTTIDYLWDLNGLLPELATERDPANTRSYTHGIGPVSVTGDGGTAFYHLDPLGSVAAITDPAGDLQWSYSYDPFGQLRNETQHDPAAPQNTLRYTGEYEDPETGLYYLRARYYDTNTGRFGQEDPLAASGLQPWTSRYAYVRSQPTVRTDPSGLIADCPGCC